MSFKEIPSHFADASKTMGVLVVALSGLITGRWKMDLSSECILSEILVDDN